MNDLAIEATGIRKTYGKFVAVDGLNLNVRENTVHGFLGPNGAGKTTVIRVLLGLLQPDEAEVEIFGMDLFRRRDEIMRRVGAIVETPAFFEFLTAYENLYYLANMSGPVSQSRIEETLKIVGLERVRDKKVGEFSFGMKQRLGIAQALLPDNKLIFLDEPVNGLDPHGIMDVRNLIRRLCEDGGVTVFLSSHLLVEVQYICDYVSIIHKGVKICEEKVSDLLNRESYFELQTPDVKRFADFASERDYEVVKTLESPEKDELPLLVFRARDGNENVPALVKSLVEAGVSIHRVDRHRKNLEEIFVELTSE